MRTDDASSYTIGDYTGTSVTDKNFWNYGAEIWCNMEGQYTTIVADLSILSTAYEMSVCSLGIMGTEYVRKTAPPKAINLGKDEVTEIEVENIYSA